MSTWWLAWVVSPREPINRFHTLARQYYDRKYPLGLTFDDNLYCIAEQLWADAEGYT